MEQAHQLLVQTNVQLENIVMQEVQVVQIVEPENTVVKEVQHVVT